MNEYKVLVEISFAARKYNPGETVMMGDTRAKKYLDQKQIELVKPAAKKEANS